MLSTGYSDFGNDGAGAVDGRGRGRTSGTVVVRGPDGELDEPGRDETAREWNVVSESSTLVIDEDVVLQTAQNAPEVLLVGRLVDGEVDQAVEFG